MPKQEIVTGGAIVSASNPLPTSLATTLDSATDSIDVDKMSKGSVTTAHNGISGTATSTEKDFRPYNALHIEVTISGTGNWDIKMTGCAVSGGTFVDQYVGTTKLIRQGMTASAGFIWPVGANYIKIVATENSGSATVTVKVTPFNMAQNMGQGNIPLEECQIGTDQTITFANSDPANTQQTNTITKPDNPLNEYELVIYNPSTVTDLTVKVFSVNASLGGGSRDALITTLSIPKSQAITGTTVNTYANYLHGIFNGTNCKLVFSNDTVLGGAEGFSAYFRLNEVA